MSSWNVLVMGTAAAAALVILVLAFGGGSNGPRAAVERPAGAADGVVCEVRFAGRALPREVPETSGLARGITRADLFWTHNDAGGEPELFGVDEAGALRQRVAVENAAAVDWEDIEAAPCGSGACLYIADTGDNDGDRESVTIYRVPEPGPGKTAVAGAALRARYPSGPRDSEALFAHDGILYLVTKGRHAPVELYRYPAVADDAGAVPTLERVAELFPQPEDAADRVTAATTSPDGRWIALATVRALLIVPSASLIRGDVEPAARSEFGALRHRQTEAVTLGERGVVWLTSEAEDGGAPTLGSLSCAMR